MAVMQVNAGSDVPRAVLAAAGALHLQAVVLRDLQHQLGAEPIAEVRPEIPSVLVLLGLEPGRQRHRVR